jgi:WD40 repeat protein
VLLNRLVIEQAPLQTYISALIFAPAKSIVRNQFKNYIPKWIRRSPELDDGWSALLQTLEGHLDIVNSIVFSSDGKQLASASGDRTVKLWDAASGKLLQMLEGHSESVNSVAFSPDGKQLVSASFDKTVKLWDAASGVLLQMLEGHSEGVNCVAFSPDGKQLASASFDRTVKLWDAASGALLQTLEGHSEGVNSVVFSPDGKQLASASSDNTVKLWDATGPGTLLQAHKSHSDSVITVAFSPDGKQLASASYDMTIRIWTAAPGALLVATEGHQGPVNAVTFSPDGNLLASVSHDSAVKLWDTGSGALLLTFQGHSSCVNSVSFSPDRKLLASASDDKTIRLWDVRSGAELQRLEGHLSSVNSVAFSLDSELLASASHDNTVKLWNTGSGALLLTFQGHSSCVNSVSFSPDRKLLASASDDKTIRLWDVRSGKVLHILKGHSLAVNALTFLHESRLVISASRDMTTRLWDTTRGSALTVIKLNEVIQRLSYSTSCLETDVGLLMYDSDLLHQSSPQLQAWFGPHLRDNRLFLEDLGDIRLPSDHRVRCIAVRRGLFALGDTSGRVMFIELARDYNPSKVTDTGIVFHADAVSHYDGSTLMDSRASALAEREVPILSDYDDSTAVRSNDQLKGEPFDVEINIDSSRNTRNLLDDDIASLVSNDEDIMSQFSHRKTSQRASAERQIGLLIANSNYLALMYQEASAVISRSRFVSNLRRLLKQFYIDLRNQAEGELEKALISIIKSKGARTRIAQMIVDLKNPNNEEIRLEMDENIRRTYKKDRAALESWASGVQYSADPESNDSQIGHDSKKHERMDRLIVEERLGRPDRVKNADEDQDELNDSDNDTTMDDEDPGAEDVESFPSFERLAQFLIGGLAFQAFSTSFALFLLPVDLRRLVLSISPKNVKFSEEEDISVSNRLKIFLESHTGTRWSWWPLKPAMPFLASGHIRMHWECVRRLILTLTITKLNRIAVRIYGKICLARGLTLCGVFCSLTEILNHIHIHVVERRTLAFSED